MPKNPSNILPKDIYLIIRGVNIMEEFKSTMLKEEPQEIIFNLDNENYVLVDMTLPIQMLFDDVMTFVSKVDF